MKSSLQWLMRAAAVAALVVGPPQAAAARSESVIGGTPTAKTLIAEVDPDFSIFREADQGGVMHQPSGMHCVLGADGFRLTHLMVSPIGKRGDDVGCDYVTDDGKVSVFATRANGTTVDETVQGVLAAIKMMHPTASPTRNPAVATYPGLADPAAFSVRMNEQNRELVRSAWIVKCGDWIVQVRATYPDGVRDDREVMAGLALIAARNSMDCGAASK